MLNKISLHRHFNDFCIGSAEHIVKYPPTYDSSLTKKDEWMRTYCEEIKIFLIHINITKSVIV